MARRLGGSIFISGVLLIASGGSLPSRAATLTAYSDEASFLAALTAPFSTEHFDLVPEGTIIDTQIPGVVISSPNATLDGFEPIRARSDSGAASPPNIIFGGFVPSTSIRQIYDFAFSPRVSAVGLYITDQSPNATAVTVSLTLADHTAQDFFVANNTGNETTPIFFGVTSDTPISAMAVISGLENDTQLFEEFGIDNLTFKSLDENPPICSGAAVVRDGVLGIDGRGTDDGPGDIGIAGVVLASTSTNVTLQIDPFEPGAGTVTFRATPFDASHDALGTIIVFDETEKSCALGVDLRAIPAGALDLQTVCTVDDSILFAVSNDDATLPGGTSACSADLPSDSEPALPAGYTPSPADDPFPCEVLTIQSPIAGGCEMVYKKAGTFDPHLRLLFSRSTDNGGTFPAFVDVTQSVESIQSIGGDPTRIKGTAVWSPVKVACALQPMSCFETDLDQDGAPLCSDDPALADCNDRDPSIRPGAPEICNGVDDDCNGLVDDHTSDSEQPCSVPGVLGACAAGRTACVQGDLTCKQTVSPTVEVCDGIDDDCNGQTDENHVFGGYLPPVKADGSSVFSRRRGSTIPFKFQVTTCQGAFVSTELPTIEILKITDAVLGSQVEDVVTTSNANTGNLYRYDTSSNQYIFNLSTMALDAGTYIARTRLADGIPHDVNFSLK